MAMAMVMVVCFKKIFAGKGFCVISSRCEFIMLCNFRAEQICIRELKCDTGRIFALVHCKQRVHMSRK